ncbi:MAG: hypothetical protein F6J86_38845 [Symploca sp. SIO1B1]|nr:hypothetical protein [Symploca sp. SIO1C2]NER99705.1 hypothetical protein [Symploca sp. SIO1B1]
MQLTLQARGRRQNLTLIYPWMGRRGSSELREADLFLTFFLTRNFILFPIPCSVRRSLLITLL